MTEMWEKDERRFEQLLKEFAFEIIEDKDCFLFFAQFIKGETNKEISKIFSNIFQR